MTKSGRFCLMATHTWIYWRVVDPCYCEDMPKGLLSVSKGRKYETSRLKLKLQGEKHVEGITLSESNLSSWCSTLREGERALAIFITPLLHRSTLFLVVCSYFLKKACIFFLWHHSSCPISISAGEFAQSFSKWSKQGYFHQNSVWSITQLQSNLQKTCKSFIYISFDQCHSFVTSCFWINFKHGFSVSLHLQMLLCSYPIPA